MDQRKRTIGMKYQLSQQGKTFDWRRKAPPKRKHHNINDDQTRIFEDDASLNTSNNTGIPYGIPADLSTESTFEQEKPTRNGDQPSSPEGTGASNQGSNMKTVLRRVKLKGVIYGAQENIKQWGCRDIGSYALVREPDNKSDPNAIKVALFGKYFMGYVPRELACWLAPQIDSGKHFLALFVRRNEHPYKDIVGLTVDIVELTNEGANRLAANCEKPNDLATHS